MGSPNVKADSGASTSHDVKEKKKRDSREGRRGEGGSKQYLGRNTGKWWRKKKYLWDKK